MSMLGCESLEYAADVERRRHYDVWRNMISRCHSVRDKAYPDYGARGIAVCARWRASFSDFLLDVGMRPTNAHSIDRIENDGNYEPGNVRWATRKEQQRNRSDSKRIEWGGETKTQAEWSDVTGLPQQTIYQRLRTGWSVGEALGFQKRSA